jgi:hypothetical protein
MPGPGTPMAEQDLVARCADTPPRFELRSE